MKRGRRIACSLFILATLLFSQWATASYVCAMWVQPAMDARELRSGCHDLGTPNTCEQHCKAGHVATDSGKLPTFPDVTDFTPLRVVLAAETVSRVAPRAWRDVPPDPPPTIRFSVLRI